MTNIVITRPQNSSSGSGVPGVSVADILITPGNSVIVDTADKLTAKWIYTLIDETNGKVLSGEVLGLNRMGTNPTHTTYAIIGDRINHKTEVIISGSGMALIIKNNTLVDIKVHVVRINVTST